MKSFMNFNEAKKAIGYITTTQLVPCLLGETGIGKTELIEQLAAEQKKDCIVLHVAQLEPSDFIGLYKTTEDGRTANCPPNWLPYKNAEDNAKKAANKEALNLLASGIINPNGGYIFLDEVNRGHEDIRQALYQLISKKEIHTYRLPSNYDIVSAANPSEKYETYEFDKALVNRFAWIRFKPESDETISYLKNKYSNNPFTLWLNSDKALLDYGEDNFDIENMSLTPRVAENLMKLWTQTNLPKENKLFLRKMLETVLPSESIESFLAFLQEVEFMSWEEIMHGLKDPKKKAKLTELIKTKRLDVLSAHVQGMGEFFSTHYLNEDSKAFPKSKQDAWIKNVVTFLSKMEDEMVTVFLDSIPQETFRRKDKKCVVFHPEFRKAFETRLGKYRDCYGTGK